MNDQIYRQDAIDALCNGECMKEGRWCDDGDCQPVRRLKALQPARSDLSDYSDKLWKAAYERGKAEAQQWIPCSGC